MFTVLSLSVVVAATAWASLLKPSICPSRLFFSSSSLPPLLLLLPTYLYCFVFSVLSLFSVNVLFLSKAFCCLRINCLFLLFFGLSGVYQLLCRFLSSSSFSKHCPFFSLLSSFTLSILSDLCLFKNCVLFVYFRHLVFWLLVERNSCRRHSSGYNHCKERQ